MKPVIEIFEVGGCVRDEILGLKSKDIDYTVTINTSESLTVEQGYQIMVDYMLQEGFQIFLETPEMFTIRAKFPVNHKMAGLTADFVLARKEVGYVEGTRRPILELGSLYDDLERRDFTCNAIAKTIDGEIIDPFDGRRAIAHKMLLTPLDADQTFLDDPLRMLRALRFSITKGFTIGPRVWAAMFIPGLITKLEQTVSKERIREEVGKMMKHDSLETIRVFAEIDRLEPRFLEVVFKEGLWLMPTFKQ